MRLAGELELDAVERSNLFYALLLKDAGCSANAHRMAALFAADDREVKATAKLLDWTDRRAALRWALRTAGRGTGLPRRIEVLRGLGEEGDVTRSFMKARCDRGAEIALMLFLSEATAAAIRSLDEHWDGRGFPDGLRGEEIPLAARIACIAQTAEVFHSRGGLKAAREIVTRRRGRWFDPVLVDAFLGFCDDGEFWAHFDAPDISQWEPPDFALDADDARLDRIAEAFARVIDAKSPFTATHSQRVAEIADGIASALDFEADQRRTMRHAALLHDIGKLAISNRILDKPGKLSDEEFRAIQTHPAHTLRILERAPCFAELADLAANHHEKLDGSGYPRSLRGHELDLPMRVLAVADMYEALTAHRPYRDALPVEEALAIVDRDVPHRLDPDVRDALKVHLGLSLTARERPRLSTARSSPAARAPRARPAPRTSDVVEPAHRRQQLR